jgi:VanZ family protein
MRWLKRWWPALVWAIAISIFSTGIFTSENTGRIIIPVLHWLFPHMPKHTLLHIHHIIRKCGHFTEYCVLSLLILRGIRAGRKGAHLRWALATIAIVACYAGLDEFHQSFVPGRTAAISDVLLDTSGGIAAQVIAALFASWRALREHRREIIEKPEKARETSAD